MTKELKQWLARVRFIQKEYNFTKPGEVIELRDNEGSLHCETGPAVRTATFIAHWENGRRHGIQTDIFGAIAYYYKDVLVPSGYILSPEKIGFEEVMKMMGCLSLIL